MKFTANRKELARAVQSVVSILEKGDRKGPINIVLSAERGNLNVSLDRYTEKIKERIKPEIEAGGTVFLDPDKLNRIMRGLKSENIEVERDKKFDMLMIRSPDSEVALPLTTGNHLKKPNFYAFLTTQFRISQKDFRDLYDRTFFAIGENESRKSLTGLNIKQVGNEIVFIAADAYRIVEYRMESSSSIPHEIILPKTSLKKIRARFAKAEELRFAFDHDSLSVSADNRTFQTQLIQADYPNLDSLLEVPTKHKIILDAEAMKNASRLLNLTNNRDPNRICKLTLSKGKLRIEGQKIYPEPVAWSEIPCDYEGEDMVRGFNVNFLDQAMQNLKGKGEIDFRPLAKDSQVFFLDPENPRVKSVLMPVKITW